MTEDIAFVPKGHGPGRPQLAGSLLLSATPARMAGGGDLMMLQQPGDDRRQQVTDH